MRSIFSGLRKTKSYFSSLGKDANQEQIILLKSLESFVYSGSYSDYAKKDVFLKFESADDNIIAVKLNMTTDAVRKVRSRLSVEAYRVVGGDVFDLLVEGSSESLKEVGLRLKIAGHSFSSCNLFPSELIERIRLSKFENSEFSFEDCIPELNLLRWLSLPKMSDVMSNVDADRLNYILRLLDDETGTLQEKMKVCEFLSCSDKEVSKKYGSTALKFPPKRDDIDSVSSQYSDESSKDIDVLSDSEDVSKSNSNVLKSSKSVLKSDSSSTDSSFKETVVSDVDIYDNSF